MKKIKEDIKNRQFERVYLLCGQERFLVRKYKKSLIAAIAGDDTVNVARFDGDTLKVKDLIEDINMLPFFAEYRLIIVEDSGLFKAADDELLDALDSIPETTVIIFDEKEPDKRTKLYKKLGKVGYVCDMKPLSDKDLALFVGQKLKKVDKKISASTVSLLLSQTGSNMFLIDNELDKLIAYVGDEEVISSEAVDAVCVEPVEGKIFEMTDAMSVKDRDKTFKLYYDLLASKEAPQKILAMLIRQFNILVTVKELLEKGHSQNAIASEAGLQPFVVGKCQRQCSNFDMKTLRSSFKRSVKTMEKIRTGLLNEQIGMELLLISFTK